MLKKTTDQTARMRRLIWVFVGRACQNGHFLTMPLYVKFILSSQIKESKQKIKLALDGLHYYRTYDRMYLWYVLLIVCFLVALIHFTDNDSESFM